MVKQSTISEEKLEWLREIGAKEYPEPIKYIYSFRGYHGGFNLSEKYIVEHTIEQLRSDYEKSKRYAEEVIAARTTQENPSHSAELTKTDRVSQNIAAFPRYQNDCSQGSIAPEQL